MLWPHIASTQAHRIETPVILDNFVAFFLEVALCFRQVSRRWTSQVLFTTCLEMRDIVVFAKKRVPRVGRIFEGKESYVNARKHCLPLISGHPSRNT